MKKNLLASKYFQVVLLALFMVLFGVQLSFATAPKSVDLAYDMGTQTLSVTIDHYTVSAGMHRIEYVEVKKNGASVSKNEYKSQPTNSVFTYRYQIPAAKGDVFEVTGTCNLWGRKTSTLTLP